MDYLDRLRSILNEINIGGENADQPAEDPDDGDQNFMDDSGGDDASADQPAEDPDDGDQNFMDDSGGDDASADQPAEDPDDGDQNFMDDDSGGEEGGEDSGEGEDPDDGDQNFMDDDSGGEEGGEDSGDSDEEGESSEEPEDGEEENQDYDINKIESELFSSLTPEQIAIKNYELKNQFIELYSIIGSTLVRINDISKSNENINVLKFVTEKLLELREMIDFNITTAYQTRTYIENNIIYQQCIATLNAIAEIIDNIPKLNNDDIETTEEVEDKGEPVEQDEESSDSLNVSDSSMSDYQEESVDYSSDYNDLF